MLCFALSTLLTSSYRSVLDFKTLSNADRAGAMNRALGKMAKKKGISEEVLVERLNKRLHFYYEGSKILNALVMACLLAIFYRHAEVVFR